MLQASTLLYLFPAGALNGAVPYGPAVGDHITLSAGLDPQQRIKSEPLTADQTTSLLEAIRAWEHWLDDCDVRAPKGYITYRCAGETLPEYFVNARGCCCVVIHAMQSWCSAVPLCSPKVNPLQHPQVANDTCEFSYIGLALMDLNDMLTKAD